MRQHDLITAGSFRCCLDHGDAEFPNTPKVGERIECLHGCGLDGGLLFDGAVWVAGWIKLETTTRRFES